MKYKIGLGLLQLVITMCWMLMGALLVSYYDIDITSKLKLVVDALGVVL